MAGITGSVPARGIGETLIERAYSSGLNSLVHKISFQHLVNTESFSYERGISNATNVVLQRVDSFRALFHIEGSVTLSECQNYIKDAPEEEMGQRFLEAIKFGFYSMCSLIVEENPIWLEAHIYHALVTSILFSTDEEMVKMLLSSPKATLISGEKFIFIFRSLAEQGSASALREILGIRSARIALSESDYRYAYRIAVRRGYTEIKEILLEDLIIRSYLARGIDEERAAGTSLSIEDGANTSSDTRRDALLNEEGESLENEINQVTYIYEYIRLPSSMTTLERDGASSIVPHTWTTLERRSTPTSHRDVHSDASSLDEETNSE